DPALHDLPLVINGTPAEGVQGGAPLELSGGEPTIQHPRRTTVPRATNKITHPKRQPRAGDQHFFPKNTGEVPNRETGHGITASWNDSTKTVTLSGTGQTFVYADLLAEVNFQDSGTDTSSGSHPVRTVTWTVNDGTNTLDASPQVTIDRAPTVSSNITTAD